MPQAKRRTTKLLPGHYMDQKTLSQLIGLSPLLEDHISNATIDRSAFHEVWEVLLWPVRELMSARGYNFEQINGVVHDIIRRAETEKFGF
jgi:hypothetical protein